MEKDVVITEKFETTSYIQRIVPSGTLKDHKNLFYLLVVVQTLWFQLKSLILKL